MKMNVNKQFLIPIFLLFSLASYAQVPGYLGKRFTLEVKGKILPTLKEGLYQDAFLENEERVSFLKIYPELSLGVSLHKRFELGISYSLFNHDVLLTSWDRFESYNNVVYYASNENRIDYDEDYSNIYDIRTSIYSLNFKFFEQGHYSPLGVYCQLGIGFVNSKVVNTRMLEMNEFSSGSFSSSDYFYSTGESVLMKDSYSMIRFSPGIYHRKGIGKYFYINYGVEYNLYKGFGYGRFDVDRNRAEYTFDTDSKTTVSQYILKYQIERNLSLTNMFMFSFGAGVIF